MSSGKLRGISESDISMLICFEHTKILQQKSSNVCFLLVVSFTKVSKSKKNVINFRNMEKKHEANIDGLASLRWQLAPQTAAVLFHTFTKYSSPYIPISKSLMKAQYITI